MIVETGAVVGPVRIAALLRKDSTFHLYEGHHLRLGLDVALRLMKTSPLTAPELLREAQLAADVRHPTLVPVIDFGEYAGMCYVVTPRVHGQTLEQHLERHPSPLPERVVLRVLSRVGEALQVMHAAGLAHRDLRPTHLRIDAKGQIRVTDPVFAAEIAQAATPSGAGDERSLYAPPESASPDWTPDAASDLYALGAIAYEAIFRAPHHAPQAAVQLLSGVGIEPPRFDRPNYCSNTVLRIVERLIAVDPGQRITTAEELLAALPSERTEPAPAPTARVRTATAQQGPARAVAASEFAAILGFLQRRFGTRSTEQADGEVVHSSLRERLVVWALLIGLLGATAAALLS
jgi:serine/threonine protein kinase